MLSLGESVDVKIGRTETFHYVEKVKSPNLWTACFGDAQVEFKEPLAASVTLFRMGGWLAA